ncbi:MAG: InlB B-repeat-containing protein [Bacteroidales bacterium]|jgi:uncharacterized repeat protein (TIGR02543 family)|nr:InlB B-repeat-containing protein [Bacteroidales bacterium]
MRNCLIKRITVLCFGLVTLLTTVCCETSGNNPKQYKVQFVSAGVVIGQQTVTLGKYATIPANPQREGYAFGGWFTDNNTFANEWNFTNTAVTQDTTLYAKWVASNPPQGIPFTEYSLPISSCQWINFDQNQVFIINSEEEFQTYVSCTGNSSSGIDFAQYSLLLVSGQSSNGINNITKEIQQLSTNIYTLTVTITQQDSPIIENWVVSIFTSKLSDFASITLNINM